MIYELGKVGPNKMLLKTIQLLSNVSVTYSEMKTYLNQISNFHRMGAHYKKGNDATAQDFEIERIIMHQSYKKPFGMSHDIALLKLSSSAQLNNAVGLACLPDTSLDLPIDNESKKCWITGIQKNLGLTSWTLGLISKPVMFVIIYKNVT